MNKVPVDRLYHTTVVVSDLRTVAQSYAEILGIERWKVVHHTAEHLADTSAFGYAASYSYSTATGSNAQGVTFQLVQPVEGFSTFTEFLITRGPGIHGMCVSILEEDEFRRLKDWLAGEGISVGQAATVDGAVTHYYFDTRKALGGFYVQVMVPRKDDWRDLARIDDEWDFSSALPMDEGGGAGDLGSALPLREGQGGGFERPAGVEVAQEIPRIGHFGVAVRNLMDRLPVYAKLFGLTSWRSVHFRHEPGSLEYSTLNGQEVQHAFLLATAGFDDFGFELLQPTFGPTHYKEEFMDRIGEGIHHLLLLPSVTETQWTALRGWVESMDVPIAMSGRVRYGSAEFFYLDTRQKLGGYLTEVICVHQQPPGPAPAYSLDFSTKAPV